MLQAAVAREENQVLVGLRPRASKRSASYEDPKKQRERIVESFLPLVRSIADRIHRRLPPGVDLESLIQAGVMGLLEAIERYNSKRGVFHAYARYRIHGEIIEYLRSLDWVSRSVRSWGRKAAAARIRLTGRLGREASSEEMAAELGMSLKQYYRVDQKLNEAMLLSLDDLAVGAEEEWKKVQEEFFHNPLQDPLTLLENKDLVEKMTAAIEELPGRERLLITLYYHEELTFREIGEILGLTEGRISQIHGQTVRRLRRSLSRKPGKNCAPVKFSPSRSFASVTARRKRIDLDFRDGERRSAARHG